MWHGKQKKAKIEQLEYVMQLYTSEVCIDYNLQGKLI